MEPSDSEVCTEDGAARVSNGEKGWLEGKFTINSNPKEYSTTKSFVGLPHSLQF